MPKTIYTDRDIDDLARRGEKEIMLTDDVYLTDLARERAEKAGIALRASKSAPVLQKPAPPVAGDTEQVVSQVKADVIAKIGPGVDAAMIERIVRRVVGQLSG
ncbi:MAG: hypothetical protein HY327_00960 [Chloroflexi bacterium]|nr:hypothetical protein [Chloroflexota bacterium]